MTLLPADNSQHYLEQLHIAINNHSFKNLQEKEAALKFSRSGDPENPPFTSKVIKTLL